MLESVEPSSLGEYLHAIVLGVVQGIAEFLPISSSGHLVISDALMRQFSGATLPAESKTMGIALHFGTLLSILVVYREELIGLLKDRRTIGLIVLATIPVGLVGVFAKKYVDAVFASPLLAGCALMVTAGFLLVGQRLQRKDEKPRQITAVAALAIGLFQAIAIVPGISRSGSTIAAAMACGQRREDAARFSFLIAIPAIGGAAVMEMKDFLTGEATFDGNMAPVLLGTVIAFVVGFFALRWLIRIVVADRMHYFAIYCLMAGALTITWQLTNSSPQIQPQAAPVASASHWQLGSSVR